MTSPHEIIRASAGAGKTYQLSTRYLRLLFDGADPSTILASTFTRKAAGEILERIFERLAGACASEESCQEFAASLERPALTLSDTRRALRALVGAMDRVQVSTLDSFFARLAAGFALDVGLQPRWKMLDESELAAFRLEAIRRMAERDQAETLRLWQLRNHGGHERSLSEQLNRLAHDAHRIFVEGDEEAWRFLEDELREAPPSRAEIDALRESLAALPEPPDKRWTAAIERDRDAIERRDFETPLSKGLGSAVLNGVGEYYRKPIGPEHQAVYEQLVELGRRELLHRVAAFNRSSHDLLARFDHEFQTLKSERSALFFDDLQRMLSNLKRLDQLQEISRRLETRIEHVLLDEFQDTSREQWHILSDLVGELASRDDGSASVFVVGDSKQAIYGWRGGEAQIFRGLHEELRLPEDAQRELSDSWRSAPAILDAVNRVYTTLGDNPQLADYPETVARWQQDYQRHASKHEDRPGQVMFHVAQESAEHTQSAQRAAVRARTVDLLEDLIAKHPGVEIGVLLRRNEELAQLRVALAERGIDASGEGGMPLARQPAVALLLSLLRVAEHPGDRIALFHLATSPLAASLGLGGDLSGGARLSARLRRQLHRDGLRAFLLQHALVLFPSCGAESRARLRQFVFAAQRFERGDSQRPGDFLRWVQEAKLENPSTATLRLMTVHRSKGLQFPIVVLCDLENSVLRLGRDRFLVGRPDPRHAPDRISRTPNELLQALSPALSELARENAELQMSERLSVLYVAMTRASHALHLVCSPDEKRRPSRSDAALLRAAFFPEGEPGPGSSTLLEGEREIPIELAEEEERTRRELRVPALKQGETPRRAAAQAPSSHETSGSVTAESRLQLGDESARHRGIALHRCFEAVSFSEDPVEEDESLLRGLRRELPGLDAEALDVHLREFHALREDAVVREALSRGYYAERWGPQIQLDLWRERGYAMRDGDLIVRGRYDRVVLGCDEGGIRCAHVLDYKSDRVDPGDEEEIARLVESYTPQMQAYRRAVARRCRLAEESVECSLLLLSASLHLPL